MKAIVINYKNMNKIEAAIDEAQGKAKERTINAYNVLSAPRIIREEYGISMKALEGCRFVCDPNAQDFPKAYKYKAMSTAFVVEVSKGSFKLVEVERTECKRSGCELEAELTEAAKEAIMAKMAKKSVRFYGSTGELRAFEIIDIGLYDEAIKKLGDEIVEEAYKTLPKYESKKTVLETCMRLYRDKYHKIFKI